MAAMMVLTSCGTSTPVFADELEYPPLQSVIDQLDADEIVRPNDYMVSVGEEFNVKVDFSNLDIPDASKVNIYLDEAINAEGSWFSTDHADTYRTTYHVEPVSGHPVYQISRSIRVKEVEKTAPVSAESTQTEPSDSNEGGSPAVEQSGEDSLMRTRSRMRTGPVLLRTHQWTAMLETQRNLPFRICQKQRMDRNRQSICLWMSPLWQMKVK